MKTIQSKKYDSNDWNYFQLEEIAKTSSGGTPKSSNKDYYVDGNIPWLTSGEVRKGRVSHFDNFITRKGLENSSAKLFPPQTILVAMYGATAGQVGILEKEASTNQAICGILPNENYSSLFLYHYFTTKTQQLLMMGTGAAQPNISQEILRTLDIHLPPLSEQNRIVSVLETWDKSIEKLVQKIEVKKQIKKGLVQDLLTGQKRLKGFMDAWKTIRLKNVCSVKKGEQLNKQDMLVDGAYPALNGGILASGYTNKFNTDENTITISEGGNSCGYVNFNMKKFWCGGHCYAIKPNKEIKNNFLYQILKSKQEVIMALRVGSGLPNIQKKSLDELRIDIPEHKEEQDAITRILTTADKEIAELEEKLLLLKEQKKYLLDSLITGKIRTPETLSTPVPK